MTLTTTVEANPAMLEESPKSGSAVIQRLIISVNSANATLTEDCQLCLERLCPGGYEVLESDQHFSADVYIWDFEGTSALPIPLESKAIHLVIAPKSDIPSLRRGLALRNVLFLQCPTTTLSLRVALEYAVATVYSRYPADTRQHFGIDRDQILQELLETNLRLQKYDDDRTNFLARAIHDIRVPLTAVHGYCGLLREGKLGEINRAQEEVLDRMGRSLERLADLVRALTGLGTKGNVQGGKPRLASADLEECIEQAIHEILPFAQQKRININRHIAPSTGTLLFDSGQIERVLVNLLDNSCKFTPKSGSIEIRGYSITADELSRLGLSKTPGGYRLDIRDNGSGISAQHIGSVFDEYTSYGGSGDRAGAGLGLAICRMILDAHGGGIWAHSDQQSTTFSFVLPFAWSASTHLESKAIKYNTI